MHNYLNRFINSKSLFLSWTSLLQCGLVWRGNSLIVFVDRKFCGFSNSNIEIKTEFMISNFDKRNGYEWCEIFGRILKVFPRKNRNTTMQVNAMLHFPWWDGKNTGNNVSNISFLFISVQSTKKITKKKQSLATSIKWNEWILAFVWWLFPTMLCRLCIWY